MSALGELLVARGWITGLQLEAARQRQKQLGGRLGTALLELDALLEPLLLQALAEQLKVPAADVEDLKNLKPEVIGLLPTKMALRAEAIPFRATTARVDLAMLDVDNLALHDELSFVIGKRLRIHVATEARIIEALAAYYGRACPTRFIHLLERLNRHRARWASEPPPRAPDEGAPSPPTSVLAVARAGLERAKRAQAPSPAPVPPPRASKITLSDAERAALRPERAGAGSPPAPIDLSETLARFDEHLEVAMSSSDVGHVLLDQLAELFDRALVFRVQRGRVAGWMGRGPGVDAEHLTAWESALDETSVFQQLRESGYLFSGILAPLPAHRKLIAVWGGPQSTECVVAPVRLGERLVAAFYGDCGDRGVDGVNLGLLVQLAARCAQALERCILRRKSGRRRSVR